MIVEKVKNGFVVTSGNPGYEEKRIMTEEEFHSDLLRMANQEVIKMMKNQNYVFKIECYISQKQKQVL